MNKPYVKQYDKNGIVINPIIGSYVNEFNNRRVRREVINEKRFYGESKNHHLTVVKTMKYNRHKQIIYCRNPKTGEYTGERRIIEHYLLKNY